MRLLVAGGAVAVLFMTGCGPSSSASPTPVATNHVELPPSYIFMPQVITVPAGTTVTWNNHDNFTHTVRLLDRADKVIGTMRPGESITYTFDKAGTYHYDCSLHPQNMHGTVIVT